MERKLLIRSLMAIAAVAIIAVLAWGAVLGIQRLLPSAKNNIPFASTTERTTISPLALPTAAGTDFSGIVEHFGPAVVNISVTGKARRSRQAEEGEELDPFFEFFRRFGPQIPQQQQKPQLIRGFGSGFIIRDDGLILTNAHVIDGAQELTVKLTDRREFKARVIGADKQTDIALIKIEAKNLPTVVTGDPGKIKVGEPVLAIGAPYGFENTATAGIVSAKSRTLPDDTYVPFIQTDVAVNPGNSGGPLFNMRGEVIGINSQIYSQTGGYQGLSFAIPINVALRVQDQLLKTGKVTRGRIGVTIQEVNQELAESFGLKSPRGALVSNVDKGGPADKAGLEPGDIIIKLGNQDIERSGDLPALVGNMNPGMATSLEIIRRGTSKTLNITIGEMKTDKVAATEQPAAPPGKLGLSVRPLTPEEAAEVGIPAGLLVEESAGPAAKAGIQPGDVVLALNGTPIRTIEDLRQQLAKVGKHAALLILRDSARIFVPVNLG